MSSHEEQLTFDECLRFFGAITASLSHEINNVLAIVNELGGLMDDFLAAADGGQPLDPKKQREILSRISSQVTRGIGYVQQLNNFAHSSDETDGAVDASDSFERITGLCGRFAKLRNVTLDISLPKENFSLRGSAFMLQHVVFRAIEIALLTSNRGDTLRVGLEDAGPGAHVRVENPSPLEETEEVKVKLEFLTQLVGKLGGKLVKEPVFGEPLEFTLYLPAMLGENG